MNILINQERNLICNENGPKRFFLESGLFFSKKKSFGQEVAVTGETGKTAQFGGATTEIDGVTANLSLKISGGNRQLSPLNLDQNVGCHFLIGVLHTFNFFVKKKGKQQTRKKKSKHTITKEKKRK